MRREPTSCPQVGARIMVVNNGLDVRVMNANGRAIVFARRESMSTPLRPCAVHGSQLKRASPTCGWT